METTRRLIQMKDMFLGDYPNKSENKSSLC